MKGSAQPNLPPKGQLLSLTSVSNFVVSLLLVVLAVVLVVVVSVTTEVIVVAAVVVVVVVRSAAIASMVKRVHLVTTRFPPMSWD